MPAQQPFYLDTVGDPITTKRRVAPQWDVDVPVYDMALYSDFRSNLGALPFTPTTIAQEILNGSINRLPDLVGKITAADGTLSLGPQDPTNPMFLIAMANLARNYSATVPLAMTITRSSSTATAAVASTAALTTGDSVWVTGAAQTEYNGRHTITVTDGTHFTYTVTGTPATPATGTPVYSTLGYTRWLFGASQPTQGPARVGICEDYNQGIPFRYHNNAVKSVTHTTAPNQNLVTKIVMALGEFSLHGQPVQTGGSGSTLPLLTKYWDGNLAADADDFDLFPKIISASGKTIKTKYSAAASYGSKTDTYVLGEFSKLYSQFTDKVDRLIGTIPEQVRIYWPVSGTTLADGDIFQVPKRIAAWTPTFTADRPTTSVNCTFLLNGREIKTEGGWSVELTTDGTERVEDVYGKQNASTFLGGQVTLTLKPTRRIADRDLQNALLKGITLPVVVEMPVETEIGTSGEFYLTRYICPAVKFAGSLFSPNEGGKDRQEALTGTAGQPDTPYTYDSLSWADAWTCEVRNDVLATFLAA